VLGDELVAGDVNQQVLLLEVLTDATGYAAQQAHGGGRDRGLRNENAGVEVALVDDVVESAHLLGADARRVRAEVDIDRAAVGLGGRVRFARQRSVLHLHDLGGAGLDFHFSAAVGRKQVLVKTGLEEQMSFRGLFHDANSSELEDHILRVAHRVGIFVAEVV